MVRKAAAVLRFWDSFTGLPVEGKILVRMAGGQPALCKPGGCYVLWEDGRWPKLVEAGGGIYERECFRLTPEERDRAGIMFCLWLAPGQSYPYPRAIGWDKRVLPGLGCGQVLEFPWVPTCGILELARDYAPDGPAGLLYLKNSGGMELSGRSLFLQKIDAGEGEKERAGADNAPVGGEGEDWGWERARLVGVPPKGGRPRHREEDTYPARDTSDAQRAGCAYMLEKPLKDSYKCGETRICLGYRVRPDSGGVCRLPYFES